MKNFALIGVAGYIAPRHLQAIKATNNKLDAALDKSDNVGILDNYFLDTDFFTEFERFDRHIDKLKRIGQNIDYVSICSPNYLHDSHIRFALRHGAHAICEKPLVLNPWNLDALQLIEKETGKKVYTILQLRHHQSILELKKMVENSPKDKVFDIDLKYITSRGRWYHYSWKGDIEKSGGVVTNIGIHFFDMLFWIFGKVKYSKTDINTTEKAGGYFELERARVNWFLSIDYNDLPDSIKAGTQRTYRSITIENNEIEFTNGFTDLHTVTYQNILADIGYGPEDARASIEFVHSIRNQL